jgi:cystathionine beta-lyase
MLRIDPWANVTEADCRARRGYKWTKYGDDVLPAWVADMDFPAPEPVREVLRWSAECSALGYERPEDTQEVYEAAAAWLATRHGWAPAPDSMTVLTDVIQGLYLALAAFTEPGDGVIVQSPIYPPFLTSVAAMGRRLLDAPLRDPCGDAAVDVEGLRRVAAAPGAKLLLLCNPHNPTGRVFRRDELEAIAAVALERDLVVVADEIWMDVVYPGARHIPFASLGADVAARTLTLVSATKAFNMAGVRCALAIFGSPALRVRFDALPPRLRGVPSVLGLRATAAAWREGGPWLATVLAHLDANRQAVARFVEGRLRGVRHRMPEGTYMAWLDCAALALPAPAAAFFLARARVALSDGAEFGGPPSCVRLNFATSPALLGALLERMARAVGR